MIKKVLKKLERLKLEKSKLIEEQSKLQEKIDTIDLEMKNYNILKKEYEKLERRFNDITQSPEVNKNEWARWKTITTLSKRY